jgi:hypothetical protein
LNNAYPTRYRTRYRFGIAWGEMATREHTRGFRAACRRSVLEYKARSDPLTERARGRGRWSADPEKNKEGFWVYASCSRPGAWFAR